MSEEISTLANSNGKGPHLGLLWSLLFSCFRDIFRLKLEQDLFICLVTRLIFFDLEDIDRFTKVVGDSDPGRRTFYF